MGWQPLTQFSAPEVLADLLETRFGATEGMERVHVVTYHASLDLMPGPEFLSLWGTDAEQVFGSIGNMRMTETYRIEGRLITARKSGADREEVARAVRARAAALMGVVQDELRSNPTLGGLVVSASLSRFDHAIGDTNEGVTCEITFTIAVEANLGITA